MPGGEAARRGDLTPVLAPLAYKQNCEILLPAQTQIKACSDAERGFVPDKSSESRLLPRRLDLAAIRQSKGVTLDQIIESTKISKRFLQAIEESDFDKLPGGVFNTSYIRQYARAIDINECELLEYYYAVKGLVPANGPASNVQRKPPGRNWRLPAVSVRS